MQTLKDPSLELSGLIELGSHYANRTFYVFLY